MSSTSESSSSSHLTSSSTKSSSSSGSGSGSRSSEQAYVRGRSSGNASPKSPDRSVQSTPSMNASSTPPSRLTTTPKSASMKSGDEIIAQAPRNDYFPTGENSTQVTKDRSDTSRSTVKLQETYGTWDTINLFLGIIIGSGIFISAKVVAQQTPNAGASILIWLLCGLYSLLGSLCFVELGTCFPESGGDFAYLRRLLGKAGNFVAFIRIWVELLMLRPASQAAIAVTTAKYLIVPFMTGDMSRMWTKSVEDVPADEETFRLTIHAYEVLISIILTTIFTAINCMSIYVTQMISGILSILKVLVLLFLVIVGIVCITQVRQLCAEQVLTPGHIGEIYYRPCIGNETPSTSFLAPDIVFNFDNSEWADYNWVSWISKLAIAAYGSMWGYAGWSDVSYAMEEIVNPSKNLPIAAWFSVTLVTGLYTMIIVGYYAVMQNWEMLDFSEATATLFILKAFKMYSGSDIAAIARFENSTYSVVVNDGMSDEALLGIRIVMSVTAVVVAMAASGSLHGSLFASARLLFVGARWNHLPEVLGGVHRDYKTPIPSLILLGVLTNIYCFAAFSDAAIEFFINSTCFVYFGSIILCVAGLIVWRLRGRPNIGSVMDDYFEDDERSPLMGIQEQSQEENENDPRPNEEEDSSDGDEGLVYRHAPVDDTRALLRATLDSEKFEKMHGSVGLASSMCFRSRKKSKGFLPDLDENTHTLTVKTDETMIEFMQPYIISLFWHFLFVIIGVVMIVFSIIDKPLQCGSGLILIIVGIPVYFLCVHNSPESPKWWRRLTAWMFVAMNCQLEEISGSSPGARSPQRLLSTNEILPGSVRNGSRASGFSNSGVRYRGQSENKARIDVEV